MIVSESAFDVHMLLTRIRMLQSHVQERRRSGRCNVGISCIGELLSTRFMGSAICGSLFTQFAGRAISRRRWRHRRGRQMGFRRDRLRGFALRAICDVEVQTSDGVAFPALRGSIYWRKWGSTNVPMRLCSVFGRPAIGRKSRETDHGLGSARIGGREPFEGRRRERGEICMIHTRSHILSFGKTHYIHGSHCGREQRGEEHLLHMSEIIFLHYSDTSSFGWVVYCTPLIRSYPFC